MKYIKQFDGSFSAYDENSEAFKAFVKLPKDRRLDFLSESDKEVKTYLAAQATKVVDAETRAASRASGIAKLVKDKGLTLEELAAVFGGGGK